MNIKGAVKICAAKVIFNSFHRLFFEDVCPKIMIPTVAAYESLREIPPNQSGFIISIKTADKNNEYNAVVFLPYIIAPYVNIPITAALTIGAFGPTNSVNKNIVSMVIKHDIRLLKKPVKEVVSAANIDIFVPDKTTIWSNPTAFIS